MTVRTLQEEPHFIHSEAKEEDPRNLIHQDILVTTTVSPQLLWQRWVKRRLLRSPRPV